MMQLKWRRTLIGGETRPGDFIAYTEWGEFCRILSRDFGPSAGTWEWALVCTRNPFHDLPYGVCDDKGEVVSLVKRMFEELRDTKRLEFRRPYMWNQKELVQVSGYKNDNAHVAKAGSLFVHLCDSNGGKEWGSFGYKTTYGQL